nr:hypothetical protein [Mycoplasmopsis bovis]
MFVKEENDPLFDKVTIKFENKNIGTLRKEKQTKRFLKSFKKKYLVLLLNFLKTLEMK